MSSQRPLHAPTCVTTDEGQGQTFFFPDVSFFCPFLCVCSSPGEAPSCRSVQEGLLLVSSCHTLNHFLPSWDQLGEEATFSPAAPLDSNNVFSQNPPLSLSPLSLSHAGSHSSSLSLSLFSHTLTLKGTQFSDLQLEQTCFIPVPLWKLHRGKCSCVQFKSTIYILFFLFPKTLKQSQGTQLYFFSSCRAWLSIYATITRPYMRIHRVIMVGPYWKMEGEIQSDCQESIRSIIYKQTHVV